MTSSDRPGLIALASALHLARHECDGNCGEPTLDETGIETRLFDLGVRAAVPSEAVTPSREEYDRLRGWAEWIVRQDERHHSTDWACAECVVATHGHPDMVIGGFRCVPHEARAALEAQGGPK